MIRTLFTSSIGLMLVFLFLPLIWIFVQETPADLIQQLRSPICNQALTLSLETTVIAVLVILCLGTPLAYVMAKRSFRGKHVLEVALQLPIVTPPAVAGVGLLLVFGQRGIFGGMNLSFSSTAVILAQIFMSAPFYIAAAKQAFESVDDQLFAVSRTLGVSPWNTFWRVVFPLAMPGLLSGTALSWARALGEFGATMMFAGNLPGKTQTLPLAIYTAMESDPHVAIAISALLLGLAFILLLFVGFIDKHARNVISGS
jgi:molybdate transport system permease protein